jgi:CHAT domain-containing protein
MPKVLVLTANRKTTPLRLGGEVQEIRSAFGEHSNFVIHHEAEVQAASFIHLLRSQEPDILHFAGHGDSNQTVKLKSGVDNEAELTASDFAAILKELPHPPKVVILNACHSAKFSSVIAPYVKAVIGSNGEIGDAAAVHFSKEFYGGLAKSQSIAASFALASASVGLAGYDAGSDMLQLIQSGGAAESIVFYAVPELMASFALEKGTPCKDKHGDYELILWLRGVDATIDTVTYQACHMSYTHPFLEVTRSTSQCFQTDDYVADGEVTFRITAWSRDRGVGVSSTLSSALRRHYGASPRPAIRKAIYIIEAN